MVGSVLKIGFLGSGEIATLVLKYLKASSEIEICFVNTQPDRIAGRKCQLMATPVADCATELNLPLYKLNVNSQEFANLCAELSPTMLVVIDFGQLLKSTVLTLPPLGCINIHASLLPAYRGASPIQSALLAQDSQTGVTFMQMEKGLDTGPIFVSEQISIPLSCKAPQLLHLLGDLAGKMAPEVLTKIAAGSLKAVPQNHERASYCHKINKMDGFADWTKSACELVAMSQAYDPWPGLYFLLPTQQHPKRIRVTNARSLKNHEKQLPGTIFSPGVGRMAIACEMDALELLKIVPEGKKEMSVTEFLHGFQLKNGTLAIGKQSTIE